MKRRNFLSRIFGGAVAVAAAPVIVKAMAQEPLPPADYILTGTHTGDLYERVNGTMQRLVYDMSNNTVWIWKDTNGIPSWVNVTDLT